MAAQNSPAVPPPMTPAAVIATGKQFGQKIGAKEAKVISALLIGWRGAKA